MTATVAVIGGGYGGITAAKALDDVAEVSLIEPRDTFVHNVATLRAVVDPSWIDRLFLPYDHLLTHGPVQRDRASRISGTQVELASGAAVSADFVVVATGSTHAYSAKIDVDDRAAAQTKLHATHEALAGADRVLLLGAGPVGLELAGEIKAMWPDKSVTLVDPSPELIAGRYPEAFRAELHRQLDRLGIQVRLGSSLRQSPPTPPGTVGSFTVPTTAGDTIAADIWFACYGARPNTGALTAGRDSAVRPDRLVEVNPHLQVSGRRNVFAIGDVTALPELKMARLAQEHGAVVAANIRTLLEGGSELTSYQPAADAIVLPLGPSGGVSYVPEAGVLGAEATSGIKGNLYLDVFRDRLGLIEVAA